VESAKDSHNAIHCRAEKAGCPRCAQFHEYGFSTAAPEQIKCANCGEKHSSAHKWCKKCKEVSGALELVTTEKCRDALKQTKMTSGATNKPMTKAAVKVPKKPVGNTGERLIVERKSVETQTDAPQQ